MRRHKSRKPGGDVKKCRENTNAAKHLAADVGRVSLTPAMKGGIDMRILQENSSIVKTDDDVGARTHVTLHFDGLCEPRNPGGHACWSYVIETPDGEQIDYGYVGYGAGMTNNVAEWTALGMALRALADSGEAVERLTIRGDSKLVVNQLTGNWRVKAEHLQKYRDRCLELLRELDCTWYAEWISREENTRADALSRQAYAEAVGLNPAYIAAGVRR